MLGFVLAVKAKPLRGGCRAALTAAGEQGSTCGKIQPLDHANTVAQNWRMVIRPGARKYELPSFLSSTFPDLSQPAFEKWLRGRAVAHRTRDRRRGNVSATVEGYKRAIYAAVLHSEGNDHYTGEPLRWDLIGKYSNIESKMHKRVYKRTLALLPSVDHVGDGLGEAEFNVCAWRTNDAKSDLSFPDFLALCRSVVEHHDRLRLNQDESAPQPPATVCCRKPAPPKH